MRKVPLRNVEIGSEIAINVRIESSLPDVQYRVRIDEGTPLEPKHLQRLKEEGIRSVFIKDPATRDLHERFDDEQLRRAEQETIQSLKSSADAIQSGNTYNVPTEELSDQVTNLIDAIKSTDISMAYTSLQSHGDYLAEHCFDVCKLSLHFALAHRQRIVERFEEDEDRSIDFDDLIEQLGIGCLLHDVGNWKIPLDTLEKSNELTTIEWEAVEQHPKMGYDILQEFDNLTELSRKPSLLHHERYDGSGYPQGLRSMNIHPFGRIVAILDVYAALTSERPYRIELTPSRALSVMRQMQEDTYSLDPELLDMFFDLIPPFPVGQDVILSNGTRGVVCELVEGYETPTVRVLFDGSEKLDEPYELIANRDDNPEIVN